MMAREYFQHSNNLTSSCCSSIVLLFLLCPLLALSYNTVKYLPGFEGPLPFELETGYIEVGKSGDVELFYYFVKSESNPETDPLMLWLTGGPGCSGFSGLVYEIGPLKFKDQEYNGSLPTLVQNPFSWTKISSIIFIDSPVGTGFSYSKSIEGSKRGDIESMDQAYQFLRKWLLSHPEFLSHSVYIGGDTYSGKTLPLLVQNIAFGIEEKRKPYINLKGYLLGNPVTDRNRDSNTILPYAHRVGLISDEIYESAKRTCRGDYINVNPDNGECLKNLLVYDKCVSRINTFHILEPVCSFASPKPQEKVQYRRSIAENFNPVIDQKRTSLLDPRPPCPAANCRGSVPEWQRCSYDLPYHYDIESSYEYHVNLSTRGYRSLIYSGDHDMSVPYLGTQAWIQALNYPIVDDGRQWLVGFPGGQVGGLTWTYSNKMTFATVKARLAPLPISFIYAVIHKFKVEASRNGTKFVCPSGVAIIADAEHYHPAVLEMARQHLQHSNKLSSCCSILALLHLLLFLVCPPPALSYSTVTSLPGFKGSLPFQLETGYVGVGESGDVQMFYYFVKSESNPEDDPIMLWFTGGPGCSGLTGFAYEIGKLLFIFNLTTIPKKDQVASIIFLDSPVGTGFSYSKAKEGSMPGDIESCDHARQFLRKWFIDHPEFLSNPVYIGGDSYSGKTVPLIFQEIVLGNEAGTQPFINLKGYLLGNPVTDSRLDNNKILPYTHRMGLISDEIYESAKRSCGGEYINVNPSNRECLKSLEAYSKCVSRINTGHILEPLCNFVSPKPKEMHKIRRYLRKNCRRLIDSKQASLLDLQPPSIPALNCRAYGDLLSYYWANDRRVRKVLQIQEGSVSDWQRCSFLQYKHEIDSSYEYHVNLSARRFTSLIYSGDHDMIVPYLATQAWIRSLNYSIVDDWRPWLVDGQVGGLGGGHTAPEYLPKECFAMFKRNRSDHNLAKTHPVDLSVHPSGVVPEVQ
ncbi:hypothetical protein IFM89_020237 [Coptis chinensis]|uniref:Serine carboxypeptidase-like 7 n=1 Tax=Coptis chinensis TaxID=261450 RepID=A0A835HLB8_9MAGN|nr:hypothetical protein IFM89_020237 [Coptis chinensis]